VVDAAGVESATDTLPSVTHLRRFGLCESTLQRLAYGAGGLLTQLRGEARNLRADERTRTAHLMSLRVLNRVLQVVLFGVLAVQEIIGLLQR